MSEALGTSVSEAQEIPDAVAQPIKSVKFKTKQKKAEDQESPDEGRVHSVTFYIRRKKQKFYSDALKEISRAIYGSSTATGKVSKYIRSLLDKDMKARGLLNAEGEPVHQALDNLRQANKTVTKTGN